MKVNIKSTDIKVLILTVIIFVISLGVFITNHFKTNLHTKNIIIDFEDEYTRTYDAFFSGNQSAIIESEKEFGLTIYLDNKLKGYNANALKVSFMHLGESTNFSNIVLSYQNSEEDQYYESYPITTDTINNWVSKEYIFNLPSFSSKTKNFKLYIWNPNKQKFFIDNLNIEI